MSDIDKLKKLFLGMALLAASAAFFYFQTSSVSHIRVLGRDVNGHWPTSVAMEDIHNLNSTWNTTAKPGSAAMSYEAVLQRQPTSSEPGAKHEQPLNLSNDDVIVLPFAKYTKPGEELLRQDWTKQLQQFLRNCSRDSPVTVVGANYLYRDVVINWLVVARLKVEPPLENILVISFDSALHELMQSVGIQSIGVFHESLLLKGDYGFKELLMARVTVLRIINYFGYDVAHYDSDAIILKNLNPLYSNHSDSDVVGSTGTFPAAAKRKWGFTLCMGAILFRSSPRTELFWETWSREAVSRDDQVCMNYAMLAMNITWDSESVRTMESHAKGERGFKVTALSQLQVCRLGQCHARDADHYYIWHKGGQKTRDSKIKTSSEIGSWYVKNNWESITMETTAKGVEWLRKIAM